MAQQIYSYYQSLNAIKPSSSKQLFKNNSKKLKKKTSKQANNRLNEDYFDSVSMIPNALDENKYFGRASMCKLPSTSTRIGNKYSAFSFKNKLKSKIFDRNSASKKMSLVAKGKKMTNLVDSFYDIEQLEQEAYPKEDIGKLVSTIYKIMDKSLGWLRIKSKSKNNIDSRKINCTLKKENAKKASKRQDKSSIERLSVISHAFSTYTSDYLMSTPKLSKARSRFSQSSFESHLENSYEDENSFSLNNSKHCDDFSHFILMNAPSMASSFDELRLHSTPRNSFADQSFSPLFCSASQQEVSSLASFSFKSNYSTCNSQSCNVASFGMTSSPVSNNYFDQNVARQCVQHSCQHTCQHTCQHAEHVLSQLGSDENEPSTQTSYDDLNSREQKLVDHLNRIKQNVRLGIELRDRLQVRRGETFKRTYNAMKADEESLEQKSSENKRQKLQHIFHVKLHRQIREIKKWQTALKNKFDSKHEASENSKNYRNQTRLDNEEIYSN